MCDVPVTTIVPVKDSHVPPGEVTMDWKARVEAGDGQELKLPISMA